MTARDWRTDKTDGSADGLGHMIGWLPSALDVEVPLWLAMGIVSASAVGAATVAVMTWL